MRVFANGSSRSFFQRYGGSVGWLISKKMPPRPKSGRHGKCSFEELLLRDADLGSDLDLGRVETGVFRFDRVGLHRKLAGNLRNRVARSDRVGAVGVQHASRSGGSALGTGGGDRTGLLGLLDLGDLAAEHADLLGDLVEG